MTENKIERIKQIDTTFYQDASTTTLDEFIFHAKRDFDTRVVVLYELSQHNDQNKPNDEWKSACKKIKDNIYSTSFYTSFKTIGLDVRDTLKFPIYHFRVNSKNINFETTITNLREWFENYGIDLYEDELIHGNCGDGKNIIRHIKDIPKWEQLFGSGEFPFMNIYVFRLGNTEYFAYTITR